ncbi:hypothetical protein ACIRG5_30210 [Lentzea sp. NPDC102401]|uniref:hypothetical protein n=1 Tax=Lentzea sp. NPDC102401 TaxID=3364128 RepID=UPI0037FB4A1E
MSSETISTTVRVTGRCPTGHTVYYDLPVSQPKGSHGLATARVECPRGCGVANLYAHFQF